MFFGPMHVSYVDKYECFVDRNPNTTRNMYGILYVGCKLKFADLGMCVDVCVCVCVCVGGGGGLELRVSESNAKCRHHIRFS